jgi:hypothetical protein
MVKTKYDINCILCLTFQKLHSTLRNNCCPMHAKKFRCKLCNKGYIYKYSLDYHYKIKKCAKANVKYCYYCNKCIDDKDSHSCRYMNLTAVTEDIKTYNENEINYNNDNVQYYLLYNFVYTLTFLLKSLK